MCPGTGGVEDFEHFGGFVEQRVLAGQCCVHPACDVEPLFARFGREVAERADGFLAWAFGGGDRLHQQIAGVGFVFVLAGALTEIHCATMVALHLRRYNIFYLNRLVTILASFDGMFTRLVDESSTYTHAATRSRPNSARMKGATVEVGLETVIRRWAECFISTPRWTRTTPTQAQNLCHLLNFGRLGPPKRQLEVAEYTWSHIKRGGAAP